MILANYDSGDKTIIGPHSVSQWCSCSVLCYKPLSFTAVHFSPLLGAQTHSQPGCGRFTSGQAKMTERECLVNKKDKRNLLSGRHHVAHRCAQKEHTHKCRQGRLLRTVEVPKPCTNKLQENLSMTTCSTCIGSQCWLCVRNMADVSKVSE